MEQFSLLSKKFKFIVILFSSLIFLALFCNGVYFWLSKNKFINDTLNISPLSVSQTSQLSNEEFSNAYKQFKAYVYNLPYQSDLVYKNSFEKYINKYQKYFKLFKDVITCVILLSLLYLSLKALPGFLYHLNSEMMIKLFYYLIIFLICVAFLESILNKVSISQLLLGARSLYFLFIILLLLPWISSLNNNAVDFICIAFSSSLIAFILFQLPFILVGSEAKIYMYNSYSMLIPGSDRAQGLLNQPSSLGIFSTLSFVFWFCCFFQRKKIKTIYLYAMFLVVTLIAFHASSVTSIALLFFFCLWLFTSLSLIRFTIPKVILSSFSLLFFLAFATWIIFQYRPDIINSILQRFSHYVIYLSYFDSNLLDIYTLLFGQGFGSGTNAFYMLSNSENNFLLDNFVNNQIFIADSMPLSILAQIGIFGVVVVFGLLLYVFIYLKQYRILIFLMTTASLFSNINELYPIYLMLGLLICLAFRQQMIEN